MIWFSLGKENPLSLDIETFPSTDPSITPISVEINIYNICTLNTACSLAFSDQT